MVVKEIYKCIQYNIVDGNLYIMICLMLPTTCLAWDVTATLRFRYHTYILLLGKVHINSALNQQTVISSLL